MKGFEFLDNDNHTVLWHGFDSSVIFNKKTQQQEFVTNTDVGIPRRMRFTFHKFK